MRIIEAICPRDGERFNPHSERPEDLEHVVREDGSECGAPGMVDGVWEVE